MTVYLMLSGKKTSGKQNQTNSIIKKKQALQSENNNINYG